MVSVRYSSTLRKIKGKTNAQKKEKRGKNTTLFDELVASRFSQDKHNPFRKFEIFHSFVR